VSTVYVVQEVENRDFFPARKFGDLELLLPPEAQVVLSATPTLRKLQRSLAEYSDEDFILLSGDPIIMSLAMMVASEVNRGRIRALKWDKREKDYYEVKIDLYGGADE
jgi:hypothetical protein